MVLRRVAKLSVAVAVFSVGIAALNRGKVETKEAGSVIDARVVIIKATSTGIAKLGVLEVGGTIVRGRDILAIDESSPAAKNKRDADQDNRSMLMQNISSLESFAAEKSKQAETYRTARLRQLDAKIDEALLSSEIARAKIKQNNATLDQKRNLVKAKLLVPSVLTGAEAASRMSEIELIMLTRKADALKAERTAARDGVYLGDNYNDTSYSQQRVDEITVRLVELRAQAMRQPKFKSPVLQIASSSDDIVLGETDIRSVKSPVDGRIWKVSVNDGDYIHEGDELAKVADCRSMFVATRRTAQEADNTVVGDSALFFGKNGSQYDGKVIISVDGDFDGLSESALGPRKPLLGERTLVVALRPNDSQVAHCPIGLSGRLVIDKEPPASSGPDPFYSRVVETAERIKTLAVRLYGQVRLLLG